MTRLIFAVALTGFFVATSTTLHAQSGYSTPNSFGGQNYYSGNGSLSGYSTPNSFGGSNYRGTSGTSSGWSWWK